jgi:outer membrane protein assembly factor BamD (BamD/ComL family)
MKKTILCTLGLLLIASCGHKNQEMDREEMLDSIEQMQERVPQTAITANATTAAQMVEMYNRFATSFPDDSLAPVFMLRAAEIDINIGNFEQAISLLDSVINLYPGFEDIAGCQFMKGWAYEQNQQYDLAREAYTEFVTNYPDHFLASDTRKMLPYIGMTPEETLEATREN